MKKEELKPIVKDFLHKMSDAWFEDKPIWKTLAYNLVDANVNKYDGVLDMFANENGDIDVEGILKSIGETMEDNYKIDLQQFHPILPNRILLITKEDIQHLVGLLSH